MLLQAYLHVLLILVLFFQPEDNAAYASQPEIFKINDNKFVMVVSTIYEVPNVETATALLTDSYGVITQPISEVKLIPDSLLKDSYTASSSLPSLIDGGSIDEFLRVRVEKCMILNHINYLVETHMVTKMMHGALLQLPDKRIFASWSGFSLMNFGFLDVKGYSLTLDEKLVVPDNHNGKRYHQEEGRLLWWGEKDILCIFTIKTMATKILQQMYTIGTVDETTKLVRFGDPILVDFELTKNHKSFIPLLHNKTMYLITSFNPLVIISLSTVTNNIASTNLLHRGEVVSNLWDDAAYGAIRGGTPTALVRGRYLSFFHTRVHGKVGVDHYFMGAITQCAEPPFDIHSVSSHPIIFDSKWYEGPWINKQFSYCVYPRSFLLDEDGVHLHLSIGFQDRDTIIVKLNINQLLRSLTLTGKCPS